MLTLIVIGFVSLCVFMTTYMHYQIHTFHASQQENALDAAAAFDAASLKSSGAAFSPPSLPRPQDVLRKNPKQIVPPPRLASSIKKTAGMSLADKLKKSDDEYKNFLHPAHLKEVHTSPEVSTLVSQMKAHYDTFDPFECPEFPPEDYPRTYSILDILKNWPPDEVDPRPARIHQSICSFDYVTERRKALNYRLAEKPFVVRNIPDMDNTVMRWSDPDYLSTMFEHKEFKCEYSENNHFMYHKAVKNPPKGYKEPTSDVMLTFEDWLSKANKHDGSSDSPHWYFRVSACTNVGKDRCPPPHHNLMYTELPIFTGGKESLFMVDPASQRGIHCRFGMKGVIAENHFDGSRNSIAVLGGERRYVLAHPDQCENMALLPSGHPSGRHSEVDWSNPDLVKFPAFGNLRANEVVLQAGDVLYLPCYWFHYIISMGTNYQCNSRSGKSDEYTKVIQQCGFMA